VRSDAPHGDPWRRQADPPRFLGGSHTHRPVLKHGGGAEHHPVKSHKGSVLRRDFESAKSRESLSRLSVAASGITGHSSRQHAAQLGTVCRHLAHGETEQSRAAVGYHLSLSRFLSGMMRL
jgi:hypothetical protein